LSARIVLAAAIAAAGTTAAAAPPSAVPPEAIGHVYTALDLKHCRHTRSRAPEDYGSWRCRGYAGIEVRVSAGDQRSYVSYGPNAATEPAASQTLAAFNSQGSTIEWRIARDRSGKAQPFATILRWNTTVSDEDGNAVRGQVLVVTRLGPGPVCQVGYVDGRANPDANKLAQQIADLHARGFRCGKDRPITLGATGPGFSRPYGVAR
jgi:hypothetical protein